MICNTAGSVLNYILLHTRIRRATAASYMAVRQRLFCSRNKCAEEDIVRTRFHSLSLSVVLSLAVYKPRPPPANPCCVCFSTLYSRRRGRRVAMGEVFANTLRIAFPKTNALPPLPSSFPPPFFSSDVDRCSSCRNARRYLKHT